DFWGRTPTQPLQAAKEIVEVAGAGRCQDFVEDAGRGVRGTRRRRGRRDGGGLLGRGRRSVRVGHFAPPWVSYPMTSPIPGPAPTRAQGRAQNGTAAKDRCRAIE